MNTATPAPRPALHVNWPHLLLLAALPPFVVACGRAGLSASTMLTLGTLLSLAWLMGAERRWPARPDWTPGRSELLRDGAFLGLNAATDALGGLLVAALALQLRALWPATAVPMAGVTPWIALPLAVALGELGPYALHRWAHAEGWGWRVHALHHAPGCVNASNNIATHPINVLWNQLSRVLPWLLLGFDAQVIAWAALFIQVQSFAVHANVAGTLGPLNRLIGTAELHRWHHSIHPAEALNYGTAIPLWDQLFGTWRAPGAAGPARVGIAGVPGGAAWRVWRALLLAPLCGRCGPRARMSGH